MTSPQLCLLPARSGDRAQDRGSTHSPMCRFASPRPPAAIQPLLNSPFSFIRIMRGRGPAVRPGGGAGSTAAPGSAASTRFGTTCTARFSEAEIAALCPVAMRLRSATAPKSTASERIGMLRDGSERWRVGFALLPAPSTTTATATATATGAGAGAGAREVWATGSALGASTIVSMPPDASTCAGGWARTRRCSQIKPFEASCRSRSARDAARPIADSTAWSSGCTSLSTSRRS